MPLMGLLYLILVGAFLYWLVQRSGAKQKSTTAHVPSSATQQRAPSAPTRIRRVPLPERIELTGEFKAALEQLENTSSNVFITGKAGTGKSTLLRHFMATTAKRCVVLAPTGLAAVQIGGASPRLQVMSVRPTRPFSTCIGTRIAGETNAPTHATRL